MTTWQACFVCSALAAGTSGGITFAFSNFIMRAFARLPAAEAIRAMQAINRAVLNPTFLLVFMGTGAATAVLTAAHVLRSGGLDNPALLVGTTLYVGGVVAVTAGRNVPLNDALDRLDPDTAPPGAWTAYSRPWTAWNHVRTFAAAGASAAFIVAALG